MQSKIRKNLPLPLAKHANAILCKFLKHEILLNKIIPSSLCANNFCERQFLNHKW